jgi:hypothetical protein
VTGGAFFNDNTRWAISRLLTTQAERGAHLLVTVDAAAPTPGWLAYHGEAESRTYRWLGKEGLVVADVCIVTEEMPPEVPIDPDVVDSLDRSLSRQALSDSSLSAVLNA